jgi:hypothetical protein
MPQEQTHQEPQPPAVVNAQDYTDELALAAPRAPANAQEALANIKDATQRAVRRQVYGGLRNDRGNHEVPERIVAETCINLCLTYGLEPAMRELMLMNGVPYVPHKAYLKIAGNNPRFRGLSSEPTPNTNKDAKYVQFKATVRVAHPDPELAKDHNRDLIFTAYGDAAPDNVTSMIAVPPKGTGAKNLDPRLIQDPAKLPKTDPDGTPKWGFLWAMGEERAERNALEKAFPLNISWQVGPLVAPDDGPKTKTVEIDTDIRADQGETGRTTRVEPATAGESPVPLAPVPEPEPAGAITPEQLEVVKEFSKSAYAPLVNLRNTYIEAHGYAGEWSKATAAAFIDHARIISEARAKTTTAERQTAAKKASTLTVD